MSDSLDARAEHLRDRAEIYREAGKEELASRTEMTAKQLNDAATEKRMGVPETESTTDMRKMAERLEAGAEEGTLNPDRWREAADSIRAVLPEGEAEVTDLPVAEDDEAQAA